MKPLTRFASRSILDSLVPLRILQPSAVGATRRIASRPLRVSTCPRCLFRTQTRGFATDNPPPRPVAEEKAPPAASDATAPKTLGEAALNGDGLDGELPSTGESRRSQVSKRFDEFMDNIQGNIFIASQRLNDLTGYSGIETLKKKISKLEATLAESQEAVRSARLVYKTTVAERASSQREVTTLLARKDTWTPIDLERFTSLYRSDHSNEQAVQEAATRLAESERMAEDLSSKLANSILARYHEEQIWSDKIRRMSTWGTWGLMGVNVLIFLVFQLGFEPWRRRRLTNGFEEKVREALEQDRQAAAAARIAELAAEPPSEAALESSVDVVVEPPAAPATMDEAAVTVEPELESAGGSSASDDLVAALLSLRSRQGIEEAVRGLFSHDVVSMRQVELTTAVIEGVAAGATLASIVVTMLFMRN